MDVLTTLPSQILTVILHFIEFSDRLALRSTCKLLLAFVDVDNSVDRFTHVFRGPTNRGKLIKVFSRKDVERDILGLNIDVRSILICNYKLSKEFSATLQEGLKGSELLESLYLWNCSLNRSRALRFFPLSLRRVVLGLRKPFKRRIISALGDLPNLTELELELIANNSNDVLDNELDRCVNLTTLKLKNFELPQSDKLVNLVHLTLDVVHVSKTFHLILPNLESLRILRMNDTRDSVANDLFVLPSLKAVEINLTKSYTANKRHKAWISKLPSNLESLVIMDIDGLLIL